MAQHDFVIDNGSGAAVRADINNVLAAISSNNSGSTAPSTTYAYMFWVDTSTNILKQRNAANTAWIDVLPDITATHGGLAALGTAQKFTAMQRFTKGGDIASASPLVLDTDGNYFDVTGTTGFSQITCTAGDFFMLQFDGALTMTDGANLDLGGNNITTAAGDRALFFAVAADTAQLIAYFTEGSSPSIPSQSEAETGTATIPRPWTAQRVRQAVEAASTSNLVKLEEITDSAVASYDFTTGIDGTYRRYLLQGFLQPASDDVHLAIRTDSDGGASFDSGAGNYKYTNVVGAASPLTSNSATEMAVGCTTGGGKVGNDADQGTTFEILFEPRSGSQQIFKWSASWEQSNDGSWNNASGGGCRLSTTIIDAVQLRFSSGNIAAGAATLYGIKN